MPDTHHTDSRDDAPKPTTEVMQLSFPASILTRYSDNRKEFTRFVKFAIVGSLGAVIDFTLLNLFHKGLGWPLLLANTTSVSVAIISNFTWNRLWTYPESRTRRKRQQLPQFALINIIGLGINNLIVVGLTALFSPYIPDPWNYNLAKAIAIGVVLFWNFGANRLWTYRGL